MRIIIHPYSYLNEINHNAANSEKILILKLTNFVVGEISEG